MLIRITVLSLCLNFSISQVLTLTSQTEYSSTSITNNIIYWYWRSTTRFVSLKIVWDRIFYTRTCMYDTPWTRLIAERIVRPKLENINDAIIYIYRIDPDNRGMEELRVTFNGTINHDSIGSLWCQITTEDGRNITKVVTVNLNINCQLSQIDNITRYHCEPAKYGWLRGSVEAKLYFNNEELATVSVSKFGFKYLKYDYGSILSCYLGPGGPIVSVTIMLPRVGEYDLEIVINSKYTTRNRFEIR